MRNGAYGEVALLKVLLETRTAETVLLATTGYTGRELCELSDVESNFYIIGSMGCVSSMGIGLALAQAPRPIVVVDGDGAALMRMGAFATNGCYGPDNFLHILLDNGTHESTGGQSTVSPNLDWAGIASACGYPYAHRGTGLEGLAQRVQAWYMNPKLTFLSIQTRVGVPEHLCRPPVSPDEVTGRLMRYLGTAS